MAWKTCNAWRTVWESTSAWRTILPTVPSTIRSSIACSPTSPAPATADLATCQGVVFHTLGIAQQFIARAKTTAGLRVTVDVLDKTYATGRKYAADFKANMTILFDDHLPKWNYRAISQAE